MENPMTSEVVTADNLVEALLGALDCANSAANVARGADQALTFMCGKMSNLSTTYDALRIELQRHYADLAWPTNQAVIDAGLVVRTWWGKQKPAEPAPDDQVKDTLRGADKSLAALTKAARESSDAYKGGHEEISQTTEWLVQTHRRLQGQEAIADAIPDLDAESAAEQASAIGQNIASITKSGPSLFTSTMSSAAELVLTRVPGSLAAELLALGKALAHSRKTAAGLARTLSTAAQR